MPKMNHQVMLETPIEADAASVSSSRIADTVNSVMSRTPSVLMWCCADAVKARVPQCEHLGIKPRMPNDEQQKLDLS